MDSESVITEGSALEELADTLRERGLSAKQIGGGRLIRVSNPAHGRLTDTVVLSKGAFWLHWDPPHRIGPASDVAGAADVIARVLSTAR